MLGHSPINPRYKNLLGNVVHTEVSKAAFETLKIRMIYAPVFLYLKQDMMLISLSRPVQVRLISPGYFFKKMPPDV